jgi:hypothetical protein
MTWENMRASTEGMVYLWAQKALPKPWLSFAQQTAGNNASGIVTYCFYEKHLLVSVLRGAIMVGR